MPKIFTDVQTGWDGIVSNNTTTTDATETTIYSISVPLNSSVLAEITVLAQTTSGAVYVVCANFHSFAYRGTNSSNNVAKSEGSTSFPDTIFGLNKKSTALFGTTEGLVKTKANTSTQAFDIRVTGKAATSVKWNWTVKYKIRSN